MEADSGQPLAGSLMDYAMPRSDNMPSFITEIAEVISPTNPLGIKAGVAYVDVGTLHGYREAIRLLSEDPPAPATRAASVSFHTAPLSKS